VALRLTVADALPLRPLDPRVRTLWWMVGVGSAGLLVPAAFTASSRLDVSGYLAPAVSAAAVLLALVVPAARYRRWRYGIRERDLFLSKGALFRSQTLIPFDRIQFVESRQGPIDRLFGLWQVLVYTAAGKSARIPGLRATEAISLREELSKVAGTLTV
jgi:membrane protein YdbS with pleckstrin-like domain